MPPIEKNLIVAERSRPASRPSLGSDKKLHDLFSIILAEYTELNSGNHLQHKKLIDLEQRQYLQQFKGWCMPEEAPGYLKAKKHDFL